MVIVKKPGGVTHGTTAAHDIKISYCVPEAKKRSDENIILQFYA